MDFELSQEQHDIKDAVEEFCSGNFSAELARLCDKEEMFPRDLHKKAAQLGFIGIHLPEEYGGQGYNLLENIIVVEAMCRSDSTLGTALILSDLGCELIAELGTPEQKERYLEKIANGESVSAIALTEPARGSALSDRLDTEASKTEDGWIINGCKTLITNAPIADLFVTLCQSDTKKEPPYRGQSLYLIDREKKGVEINEIKGKLRIRASPLGEVNFEDVNVADESLLGEKGRGFYRTLEFFSKSRVEIAAQGLGIAEGALDRALIYSKEREVSGIPIANFQAISHKLAEMAIRIESARLLVYKAAWLIDQGSPDPMLSSMAKDRAGRVAVEVTDEAIQIFGGYGYISEYDVERFYRDAKITELYEGTREIQRDTVTRFLLRR